ncbi:hypothetical protein N7527_008810 [Penicillium freii]|uniref:Uncharacterized protein n=1 Tax=Penicillium freii TaxID=48697 RepID=A0A124GQJ4_PENFR|nr:hypothetical protein N7527_008810 [Penicillium freii]KUM58312.1 hypothetical protein ACN42_g8837 [Penicillium freii]
MPYRKQINHKTTDSFLSGWPNITKGDMVQALSPDESTDLSALQTAGSLPLPDGITFNTTLGLDPDLVTVYWCDLAVAITNQPDGDMGNYVALANSDLARGDSTTQNINYFLPTCLIKAFHPRRAGVALYWDAVMDVKDEVDRFS